MLFTKASAFALVGVLTTVGFACSSGAEKESAPASGDAVEMDASDQTRSELGVETWGLDGGDNRFTVIRGYDASHAPIVEFDYRTRRGPKRIFEARLRSKDGDVRMELATDGASSSIEVVENMFQTDAKARRVLDRIVSDLRTQPARATSSSKTQSFRMRVHGLTDSDGGGLVNDEPLNLLPGCAGSIVGSAHAGARAASSCMDSNSSNCNSANIDKASKAQESSQSDCKTTTGDRFPVAGPHNLGYDVNWATWTCDGANANSDYHTGAGDANHQSGHLGNDIFGAIGTKLVAMTDSTVVGTTTEAESSIGGNTVTLKDKDGWTYYYAHMAAPTSLTNGQSVTAGTEVGQLGKTGQARSTEAHLHFSIYPNDDYDQGIDPFDRLEKVDQDACK